ncbi:MAG: sugar phosphate permease [Candidatus Aminicenantes bacterium RBG_13_62_12]|nr:MAG: sugar phosphate permease [Candidatus Aminicenantes bacterium RBG_13_62_12]
MKEQTPFRVYSYRWIVLAAFAVMGVMNQVLWITFAPITSAAAAFYHTSDLMIGLLSMVFMVVFIVIFLPSAYVIDTRGFRAAVGTGAVLTAVFGLTRGLFASNYTLVFISQVGIAVGQPFIIGAITKVAARWFPVEERATASGIGTLALYLGPLLAMFLTPHLVLRIGIPSTLLIYGIAAAVAAVFFLLAAREHPPTPAGPDERALMLDGLRSMLRQRDFLFLMIVFFIGLGMFNALSTWIEDIIRPRGFTISQAGRLGGLMLGGGIVGAIVVSLLSDRFRRRKPFILLALAGLIPGLIGMTYGTATWLLLLSGFAFGFFLLSAGPVGFQYAAEITHPAPEGTSNTLLLVMGQVSGIVFILGMDALRVRPSGAMTTSLLILIVLSLLNFILAVALPESPIYEKFRPKNKEGHR